MVLWGSHVVKMCERERDTGVVRMSRSGGVQVGMREGKEVRTKEWYGGRWSSFL